MVIGNEEPISSKKLPIEQHKQTTTKSDPQSVAPSPEKSRSLPVVIQPELRKDTATIFPNSLPIVNEYTEGMEERNDDHHQDITPSNDEAQTLFDLASAYISMGDKAEAKETLQQVLDKGTGEVRENARKLLNEIS